MPREQRSERIMQSNPSVHVRPARGVRLIERGGKVVAFPEPHRTPVLPAGWAPLSREQQEAVLAACDAAPEAMVLRLGSPWEPGSEYRVYRLANDLWGGLSIVARATTEASDARTPSQPPPAVNGSLLGLAWETVRAIRLALDFYNWDLDAQGQPWRFDVTDLALERS